jgi:hypothetical protein
MYMLLFSVLLIAASGSGLLTRTRFIFNTTKGHVDQLHVSANNNDSYTTFQIAPKQTEIVVGWPLYEIDHIILQSKEKECSFVVGNLSSVVPGDSEIIVTLGCDFGQKSKSCTLF